MLCTFEKQVDLVSFESCFPQSPSQAPGRTRPCSHVLNPSPAAPGGCNPACSIGAEGWRNATLHAVKTWHLAETTWKSPGKSSGTARHERIGVNRWSNTNLIISLSKPTCGYILLLGRIQDALNVSGYNSEWNQRKVYDYHHSSSFLYGFFKVA